MKFQFSKIIMLLLTLLFIAVVVYACIFGNEENYVVMAALIAATGSVTLTAFMAYNKNSYVEKIIRQKTDIVKITAEERLKYNKEMLTFMQENGFTQEDLAQVEEDSPMDEIDTEALDSLNASINTAVEEASEPPEVQQITV